MWKIGSLIPSQVKPMTCRMYSWHYLPCCSALLEYSKYWLVWCQDGTEWVIVLVDCSPSGISLLSRHQCALSQVGTCWILNCRLSWLKAPESDECKRFSKLRHTSILDLTYPNAQFEEIIKTFKTKTIIEIWFYRANLEHDKVYFACFNFNISKKVAIQNKSYLNKRKVTS